LIDAHVHIDQYGNDLSKALEEIRDHEIRTWAVSMDIPSYQETRNIARSEPLILPSFGIHPWKASEYVNRLDELDKPLETTPAIGEIGLDRRFIKDDKQYPDQELIFNYQLHAAEQYGKLVNLHTSGAEKLILKYLQSRSLSEIIIHWYNGPMELIEDFLDLGAYFTIGVEVFDSDRIRSLASLLPEDRILTETDNPNGWEWLHGKRGFPHLIEFVEMEIASIRNMKYEDFSELVSSNFDDLLISADLTDFTSTDDD
jgi:TatD DNase family protein